MTVADNYNIEKQATNGTTKTFSFNFYTFSKDFVKVIKETDGVQSVVPSNQYTIKLNTVGGNVIFGVAPASGSYIIIVRDTPREQETSFSTSSGFPAKTVEGRFDKLTSMIQEMQDTDNRTPSFPVGTELNVTLPLPEAGKAIIWNNTEDGLENSQSTFDDIITTAVAAKDAAEFAQGKAEDAQTAAETAQRLAESAKDDAVAAKTDAETAVAGFDDYVDSRKSEIDAYVETASDAASAASTSATNAHNSEVAAASSESNASDYKDLAYTYSQNAYQSANDAQTEADNIRSALDGYATKAELPVVTDKTITIQKNSTDVGSFTTNSANDITINIPIPVRASDIDALSTDTKYGAAVSLSVNPSTFVLTAQLKDQNGSNLGDASTVDLPLESVVVNGTYDDDNKEIVLTLQSGATIEIPVADLVAGLQSEITSDNMLDSDLVDDSTSANKFVTASDKTTWNGKQDVISDLETIRSGASAGATALQPSALNGYATEQWVVNQGYLTGITSLMVTTALGYTPYDSSNPNGYTNNIGTVTSVNNTSPDENGNVTVPNFTGTDGEEDGAAGLVPAPTTSDYSYVLKGNGSWGQVDYYELTNRPTIPTSADYWTITTDQTSSGKKMINYTQASAQDNGFRVIAKSDSSSVGTTGAWTARVLIGNEKRTFLMGTARNTTTPTQSICGIGAHAWSSAISQTGAAWDNVYFQPDGSMGCYLGGNGWRGSSGWFRVLNNNSGNASYRTSINTGTATSPTWRTVLPNQASGTSSVQIKNDISATFSYTYATSVGGTITANYGSSFGYNSSAGNYGVALGASAVASGNNSIQLGQGTNSTPNTLSVGLSSSLNVQLLDSSGVIPIGRIDLTQITGYDSTVAQTLKHAANGAVAWVND